MGHTASWQTIFKIICNYIEPPRTLLFPLISNVRDKRRKITTHACLFCFGFFDFKEHRSFRNYQKKQRWHAEKRMSA